MKKRLLFAYSGKKRRTGYLSADPHAKRTGAKFFQYHELKQAFHCAISVSLVSSAGFVAYMSGLPIGGMMSKIAASMVLGRDEESWRTDNEKRSTHGFDTPGDDWCRYALTLRYVDDVLVISHFFCRCCLQDFVRKCYCVPFDFSDDDDCLQWVDLHILLPSLRLSLKPRSVKLPPPWGSDKVLLRSVLMGLLSRLSELKLDQQAKIAAIVDFFDGCVACGYSKTFLRKALYVGFRHHLQDEVALAKFIVGSSRFWSRPSPHVIMGHVS